MKKRNKIIVDLKNKPTPLDKKEILERLKKLKNKDTNNLWEFKE